jgi:glycosyltransferase involved in cell wall biosynthesis
LGQIQSISVVLCTYNGAEFIEEQLSSIFAQTYSVAEVIIVDDKSTDNTFHLLQSWADRYPAIRLYQNQERLGATRNFEKAMRLATNEVIAISDQDDIWHPQKLEKLISAFSENSLLIYCNSVRFTDTPDFSVKSNPTHIRFCGTDGRKIFIFNAVSGHAMMLKKKLLEHAIPFAENVMYDWWMAVIASCNGGVQYLPDVLVLQRVHDNNVTINDSYDYGSPKNRIYFKRMVLTHLQQFIDTPGMPAEDRQMVRKLFLLWKDALDKRFSPGLFWFLFQHRKILFSFKSKRTVFFTHLKYCWWFSKN